MRALTLLLTVAIKKIAAVANRTRGADVREFVL
jgi:hypothetical protein